MASSWIALCDEEVREDLTRAMGAGEREAKLSFANDAQELRQWAQESGKRLGVVVGPLSGSLSNINVAAAIARDDSARCVALASKEVDEDLLGRAREAGVSHVVEMTPEEADGFELEEPSIPSDEVPTMIVMPDERPKIDALSSVPKVEEALGRVRERVPEAKPVREGKPADKVRPAVTPQPAVASPPVATTRRPRRSVVEGVAPIVALFSGRGGVGKTSLTAVMAQAAASWGMRVALCDLDLPFGNLYSCFGMAGPADLIGPTAQMPLVEREILELGGEVGERMTLWGSCARPETSELVSPHVQLLLETLSMHHDLVLVDTSSTFDDAVAQIAQQCDRMLLVSDGRPGSNVTQARLGSLAVRLGVARTRIACLVNRCSNRSRVDQVVNRANVGLETARVFRVVDGGVEVSSCMAEGNVGELFELGSRFCDTATHALAQVLAELGVLPDQADAKRALERRDVHSRWAFGRRKEAM